MSPRLTRAFFARPATEVAPDLLGRSLIRKTPSGQRLAVRVVETEAYEPGDPASHAFRGPTPRNQVMFGQAGVLYVYFVYGMHWCANVVTGPVGEGSAVLLRSGQPVQGAAVMQENRSGRAPIASGPGRLAQALAFSGDDTGLDVTVSTVCWFEGAAGLAPGEIASGPRIGLRVATDVPWRFWERGNASVSGPRVVDEAPRAAR